MKKYIVFIIIIVLAALVFFFSRKMREEGKMVASLKVENVDFKKVKNGEYSGECLGDLITAKVNVSVKNGAVSKIDIIEHKHGPGRGADKITEDIIKKQSLEVDAVTGASNSSIVIRKAVENALRKGI